MANSQEFRSRVTFGGCWEQGLEAQFQTPKDIYKEASEAEIVTQQGVQIVHLASAEITSK